MWHSINNEVMKSSSDGQLLDEQEMAQVQPTVQSAERSKLKRTFTLPRNLFHTRINFKINNAPNSEDDNKSEGDKNNKKLFSKPSIKRFINKIAQHIGGVSVVNHNSSRVPSLGLQTWDSEDIPGVTGLKNHGNTCFINAVLQCISNTEVLAEYFVLDKYKIDLSRRNKMNSKKFGTRGEVTEQVALLLKALWACQYDSELSVTFKQVVERHGGQYKGTQQHDALEFLQWLLDKVHEDLNTASKRKYKSIKTFGRPDEVIAAETLENYKRCNDSFIQGIFQAQYRSSLSCSRCCTQSNTFDPFQCISVQLPQFFKNSIYVTVIYTSQQPRQVKIGVSIPSGSTVSEFRMILEADTSIDHSNMLILEICENGFLRTFTDSQCINTISDSDPIYCIEVSQLKDISEDSTSAYLLLCWINVTTSDSGIRMFGSPYSMQVSRETSYKDLQKLILKEMASILHDDILTASQSSDIFKIRIFDPSYRDNEPPCYLEPSLEHPLFTEAVDQVLALCSQDGGPQHVKLILEWSKEQKTSIIADDTDLVEEHSSVKQLRSQALQGSGAPLTLEECLRDYTEAETLTDAWRCPHCQQYQPVIKTLDVWSLPNILVVHLKRFRQQALRGNASSTKLTTMVDFPVNGLDMTPHLANKSNTSLYHNGSIPETDNPLSWSPWKRTLKRTNSNENLYNLYAVCYHHGTDLETGHYTAACKNSYNNQWYIYDDSKVINLSDQTDDVSPFLVNNSAYILFYQKQNSKFSSKASSSSIEANADHWVMKMPKFISPKNYKSVERILQQKKENNNEQDDSNQNNETVSPSQVDMTLRNAKNTLKESSQNITNLLDQGYKNDQKHDTFCNQLDESKHEKS